MGFCTSDPDSCLLSLCQLVHRFNLSSWVTFRNCRRTDIVVGLLDGQSLKLLESTMLQACKHHHISHVGLPNQPTSRWDSSKLISFWNLQPKYSYQQDLWPCVTLQVELLDRESSNFNNASKMDCKHKTHWANETPTSRWDSSNRISVLDLAPQIMIKVCVYEFWISHW